MNFDIDLKRGKTGEAILDEHFSDRYNIEEISVAKEISLGYDRIFTHKKSNKVTRVEYKTDYMTLKTGNMFLETEVLTYASQARKLGWTLHTQADIIIYFCHPVMLIMKAQKLKQIIPVLEMQYRTSKTKNDINEAKGILVPFMGIFNNKQITIRSEQINDSTKP